MSIITTKIASPIEANGSATAASDYDQFRRSGRASRRRTALDHYDSILWRLRPQLASTRTVATSLGIVGAGDGVGTTTVAANLAHRLVHHVDGPVLLVDANFYRPRADRLLGLKKNPGLAEVLADGVPLADAVQPTRHAGFDLLAAGRAGMLATLGVHPEAVDALVNELREAYTAVVFDFSKAADLGPSLLLAQRCDLALLVARAERTRRGAAEQAVERLRLDGVPLAGSVLNRQRDYVPRWLCRWL